MKNGKMKSNGSSAGRITDVTCGPVLYETITDWYVNGTYQGTLTTYSWEITCNFSDPGTESVDVPSGVGGSANKTFIGTCSGCDNTKIIIVYDSNGDPVEDPCVGDPLGRMEIMNNNQGYQSNRFGCVRVNIVPTCSSGPYNRFHGGIDLQAEFGTPIYSINDEKVILSQSGSVDFGNWVIVMSGGHYFAYAHLNQPSTLRSGDNVSAGTIISIAGNSGNADDPHLHFAVRKFNGSGKTKTSWNNSEKKNPETFLYTQFNNVGQVIHDCN